MSPAQRLAVILAASAALAVPIATDEGWVNRGYRDPVGIPTACAGHTGPDVVVGRVYSDQECQKLLAADLARTGLEIDRCIAVPIPDDSRKAFTRFAFNAGSDRFCKSTMAARLNAGDLRGACAELSRWVYAGKPPRVLPGLVKRRKSEREQCERGLAAGQVADWSTPRITIKGGGHYGTPADGVYST